MNSLSALLTLFAAMPAPASNQDEGAECRRLCDAAESELGGGVGAEDRLERALALFDRAEWRAARLRAPAARAALLLRARSGRARALFSLGSYAEVVRSCRALLRQRSASAQERKTVFYLLIVSLGELRRTTEITRFYEENAARGATAGDFDLRGVSLEAARELIRRQRPRAARTLIGLAGRSLEREGDAPAASAGRAQQLRDLAAVELALAEGRYAKVESMVSNLVGAGSRHPAKEESDHQARLRLHAARAALEQERFSAARKWLLRAISSAPQRDDGLRLEAAILMASVDRRQGRFEAALARLGALSPPASGGDLGWRLMIERAFADLEAGREEAARPILVELEKTAGMPPALVARVWEARAMLARLEGRPAEAARLLREVLRRTRRSSDRTSSRETGMPRAARGALEGLLELIEEGALNPGGEVRSALLGAFGRPARAAAPGPGVGELLYFAGQRGVHAVFLDAEGMRVERLGSSAALHAIIRPLPRWSAPGVLGARSDLAALLPAEIDSPRIEQLGIAPDRFLWRVPFEALLEERGSAPDRAVALGYIAPRDSAWDPSSGVLSPPLEQAEYDFIAFGDPRLRESAVVPRAREEIEAVSACFPGRRSQIYLGAEATAERLLDGGALSDRAGGLTRCRVLHISCSAKLIEGRLALEFPAAAGDALRRVDAQALEQASAAGGLAAADLVVLSALVSGDELPERREVVRLAQAFQAGGARTILIGLRSAGELGSSLVLGYSYEALARGATAARAWEQARSRLRRDHAEAVQRTLLIGDGLLRLRGIDPPDLKVLELRPTGHPWWLYIGAAILIPVLVFLLLRRIAAKT